MRINGKSRLSFLMLLIITFIFNSIIVLDLYGQVSNNHYEKIGIVGEASNKGVFDPSIEYNSNGSVGLMVYSALSSPDDKRKMLPIAKYVSTHLAKTTDHGKTWEFISIINQSVEGSIKYHGKIIHGVWWNEVPTILYDPDDSGRNWKLYWHKYFAIPKPYFNVPISIKRNPIIFPEYMWIAYKYAESPEKLFAAKEIILFGSGKFPVKPYSARYDLNKIISWPEARAYSEPGSIYIDGKIYLSLIGYTGQDIKSNKMFLIESYDHGKSWKFIGDILDHDDAVSFGFSAFTASSIVEENERYFLLVAPVKIVKGNRVPIGTYIFEFDDISKALLKRNKKGDLIAYKYIKRSLPGELNSGESDYDKYNTYGGIIIPQADIGSAPAYAQIFNTKEKIIEDR